MGLFKRNPETGKHDNKIVMAGYNACHFLEKNMATTRLIPMHAHSGTSLTTSLGLRTDYAKNPDKTEEGKYISSYRCDQEQVTE